MSREEVEEYSFDFPAFMVYVSMVVGIIGIIAGVGLAIELKGTGVLWAICLSSGFSFLIVSAIIKALVDIRDRTKEA